MKAQFVALIFVCISFSLFQSAWTRREKGEKEKVLRAENGTAEDDGLENSTESSGFGPWRVWSRCNRNCKQFRTRRCLDFEICENKTQKIFRSCRSSDCRRRNLVVMHNSNNSNKRPSKFKILNHLTPYLYSEWSQWSPCSKSCYTKRTRSCIFPEICGSNTAKEDYKSCYREGDDCEKKYLERLQHLTKNGTQLNDVEIPKHPLDNMTCGFPDINPDVRITGGRQAIKGSWPWQVLILNGRNEPFCGGVLLSDKWVLTAAHCVRRRLFVRAGEHDLSRFENTEQQDRVTSFFVFPEYDPLTVDNDLALLKMRIPFELTRYVKPICLPSIDEDLAFYSRATILGWGKRRNFSTFGTDILHQAEVPIIPGEECSKSYDEYFISENMLCAGYESGKVDSCRGDSGGPLMYKRKDGSWAVYGITSFGDGCGEERKYGVYANVMNHLEWIRGIIQSGEMSMSDDEL